MKAILDHIGIAVADIDKALAFYRDALGLEVEGVEDVATQRVRAHFLPVSGAPDPNVGPGATLELLEATSPDSPISRYLEKRGPGIHHITLRVDNIAAALAQLKSRGVRLIDEQPRPGAEGAQVAFIHPSSAHGVLVELKQSKSVAMPAAASVGSPAVFQRYNLGDLELTSLHDGFLHVDGGAMFGIVPKTLWEQKAPCDERNRVTLALRPLVVRGVRTLLIDAGVGDKDDPKRFDVFGVDRSITLEQSMAAAGIRPEDIDIVLATHLHFDHAGGFTWRDASGRLRPRFPRARYVVRRGEWEDAGNTDERNRAAYRADDLLPLAEAGVLEMVADDQTIMPGVRVRRTGGHTLHHQAVWIESQGRHAAYLGDLVPTAAHVRPPWIMGIDLHPVDTLSAKKVFVAEARTKDALVFLAHDPAMAAGRIQEVDGNVRMTEDRA